MRFKPIILLLSLAIIAGCKTTSTTQPPANSSQSAPATTTTSPSLSGQTSSPQGEAAKPKLDACALLTSKEIEAVQGEAVKETKLSGQSDGGFHISQCFFTLPTFTNSVSLLVAQKGDGAAAKDPKEFWENAFHEEKTGEKGDRERERDRDKKKGEEEESTPPKKVAGIGDDAFWVGSRVGGALYALKGNAYIRISIGGPSDQESKIKKSKALAQKALARL